MSNTTFAPFPIPVVTPKGSGYIVYVKCNAMWENDEVCVAMDDGGQYFHFNTGQLSAYKNATYGINSSPKESYTEEWYRKLYEGQSIPVTPHTNIGTVNNPKWSDEDMVRFCAFCKFAPGKEISEQLDLFKEKNNIK